MAGRRCRKTAAAGFEPASIVLDRPQRIGRSRFLLVDEEVPAIASELFEPEALRDKAFSMGKGWNRLMSEERETILDVAYEHPEWSSREVALLGHPERPFSAHIARIG